MKKDIITFYSESENDSKYKKKIFYENYGEKPNTDTHTDTYTYVWYFETGFLGVALGLAL